MRRVALILACLGPTIAQAGWSPAWTNGSIWAHQRCVKDLYNAYNERRLLFAAGPYYTITAPTIWPSFSWLTTLDARLQSIGTKFVDRGQAGTNNHFDAYFADNPTSWAPSYTWSSLLTDAGVTNFRVCATNQTIWPRLSDLMQRRRVIERLTWTKSFWWFEGEGSDWIGEANDTDAATTNWPALEQVAETNWHGIADSDNADVMAYSAKYDAYPGNPKGGELRRRRGTVKALSIDAPTDANGAYSVTNRSFRRDVDHYINVVADRSGVSCATELTGYAGAWTGYTNCNAYFDGEHDFHGDDAMLPLTGPLATNKFWSVATFTQSVTYAGLVVGATNPVPDWCSNPVNPGGGSTDRHIKGYTMGSAVSGMTIQFDFDASHCVIRWSGLTYP